MTMSKSKKKEKMNGRNKSISIFFMIGTLFFWYYALNHLWFYIYKNPGFTQTGALFGTMVSLGSGLIYAYLIYGLIRSNNFNLMRSIVLLLAMVVLSIYMIILFPIDP